MEGPDTSPGGAAVEAAPVPWDRPGRNPVRALAATVWACLRHPVRFFSAVAESEDRWVALGFALVMDVLGYGVAAGWRTALDGGLDGVVLLSVLIAPLRVLATIWLGSELMHGTLRLLRGVTRPRAVTHRAVAYCYATAVLGAVPYYGILAGLGAAAVYHVVALRTVHRAPWWKAAVAALVTWAVLGGLLLIAALSGEASPPAEG